ncbi:hypothetical protein VZT92_007801 [Zoarces viviparus]|uniref:Uncharacterized protein n=1 Tax=Zoarces viviparus TaxID=48416 RepID=A0AAW1FLD5_ZOAVI
MHGKTHQIGQGQTEERVSAFAGIMTQSVSVKLLLSFIGQEVVPSDGLKTQEVDIGMPGIPALCFLYRDEKDLCIALCT